MIEDKTQAIKNLKLNVDRLAVELDNALYVLYRNAKLLKYNYNGDPDRKLFDDFVKLVESTKQKESELAQCAVEWLNASRRNDTSIVEEVKEREEK